MDKITLRLKTRLKEVKREVNKLLREETLIEKKLLKRLPENDEIRLRIIFSEKWKILQ
jgi:hypothetical protein